MTRALEYRAVERDVLHGLLWSVSGIFALALITFAVTNEQHESSLLVARTERTLASISDIGELTLDAESTARGYFLFGSPVSMDRYAKLLPLIDSELDNFRGLCLDNPTQLRLADRIKEQIDAKFSYTSALVALRRDEGMNAVLRYVGPGGEPGRTAMDLIRVTLREMEAEERRILDKRMRAQNSTRHAVWAIIIMLVIIGCGMLTLGYRQTMRALKLRREAEERADHLAHHDGLTGLPNRRLLEDRLLQAIALARRHAHCMAVLFIDLDGFKAVNDKLGHDGGDELLKQVAARLLRDMRETDTVARLGGDEFVVGLTHIAQADNAMTVAEKLIKILGAPYEIKGETVRITASIGVALHPEHANDCATAMKAADAALYVAKASGKNVCSLAPLPRLPEASLVT